MHTSAMNVWSLIERENGSLMTEMDFSFETPSLNLPGCAAAQLPNTLRWEERLDARVPTQHGWKGASKAFYSCDSHNHICPSRLVCCLFSNTDSTSAGALPFKYFKHLPCGDTPVLLCKWLQNGLIIGEGLSTNLKDANTSEIHGW